MPEVDRHRPGFLSAEHQRPPRLRSWRRHCAVPYRPGAVHRPEHRSLRVVQRRAASAAWASGCATVCSKASPTATCPMRGRWQHPTVDEATAKVHAAADGRFTTAPRAARIPPSSRCSQLLSPLKVEALKPTAASPSTSPARAAFSSESASPSAVGRAARQAPHPGADGRQRQDHPLGDGALCLCLRLRAGAGSWPARSPLLLLCAAMVVAGGERALLWPLAGVRCAASHGVAKPARSIGAGPARPVCCVLVALAPVGRRR